MSVPYTWTFTASGNGASVQPEHKNMLELLGYGTWGGGTAKLQFSPDSGTTWIDLLSSSGTLMTLNANGVIPNIVCATSDLLRVVLTGATSPSLTFVLREVVGV